MGSVSHNGNAVVCNGCQSPLRAAAVVHLPLAINGTEVYADDVIADAAPGDPVECSNCGMPLGTVGSLSEDLRNADIERSLLREASGV